MTIKESSPLNIRAVVMKEATGKEGTYYMCVPWEGTPPEITFVRLGHPDWKGEYSPRKWDTVLLMGVTQRAHSIGRARKLKARGWYAHEGYPWKPEHQRLIGAEAR